MLERFLDKTSFSSQEDFMKNFKVKVPDCFNFGYDVVDEWARIAPEKKALLWTNDQGKRIDFTFADIKRESDKTASYFQSLGIGHGDMVMLILKRRYEFWFSIIALHKLGAVCIPATSVVRILIKNYNVNPLQIQPSGRGEYMPVDDNETAEGRSKNRRTEIIMAPKLDKLFQMLQSSEESK
jgi:hypothetical protein